MMHILSKLISFFKNPYYNLNSNDICLAKPIKKCCGDEHYFAVILTKNSVRVSEGTPCYCKKYNDVYSYYLESEINNLKKHGG